MSPVRGLLPTVLIVLIRQMLQGVSSLPGQVFCGFKPRMDVERDVGPIVQPGEKA